MAAVGPWIAILVIVVVVLAAAAVVVVRRRRPSESAAPEPATAARAATPISSPMTDLESALAKVTDRDGRPIKERIDAESVHVDPLRDPEDTGPLLRRALDSVAHHEVDPTTGEAEPPQPDA